MTERVSTSTPLTEILCCPKLQTHDGQLIHTAEVVQRWASTQTSVVGIYVSASWCPPCQKFTPQLKRFSEKLESGASSATQEGEETRDAMRFPIIFVSCDKTPEEFLKYYSSMPSSWLAIPFEERVTRRRPMEQCGVSQIPTLLVFDVVTGHCLTKEGVTAIGSDPAGKQFPWKNFVSPWYKSTWFLAILRKLPIILIVLFMTFWQNYKQRKALQSSSKSEL